MYCRGGGGGFKGQWDPHSRETGGDCRAEHGGGKAIGHAFDEGECHGYGMPYEDGGSAGNLQKRGDPCGGCGAGEDAGWGVCGPWGSGH